MGLSPYDKKSYKESKRRRRQALLQSETGYIKPYKRGKSPLVIALCVILAVCIAGAAAFLLIRAFAPGGSGAAATPGEARDDVQLLRVVNKASPMGRDEVPPLEKFGGVMLDPAATAELEKMSRAAQSQGLTLRITSGYVSFDEQQRLYEENLAVYMNSPDYTPVRAQATAQSIVPGAGCSEAQTGLLVTFDISDGKTKSFIERECINYGFILRFPREKEDHTHIRGSDAVYRYVGKEHAEKMRAFDLCLEEYVDYLSNRQ